MTSLPANSIEARIFVRSTADGGRRHPVFSGYRASFWLGRREDGRSAYNDAGVYLKVGEELAPGQTGEAWLIPLRPEFWGHLRVGDVIEMSEGERVVGTATVTAVHLDPGSSPAAPEASGGEAKVIAASD
jgi:translation elongation factor EF-Tu-like GTPase